MEIENIIEICIGLDIAIIGIAYPLIIDKTSSIGDRFSSHYIFVLFTYEFPESSWFSRRKSISISSLECIIYLVIFSFIFRVFKFYPLDGVDNWVISNSANLIIIVLSVILIFFFFVWIYKVKIYNGNSVFLLKYIINKHEQKNVSEIKDYSLKAINEVILYSISKQDEHTQETILEFYFKKLSGIRRANLPGKPLVYPFDVYQMIYKVCNEVIATDNKKLGAIEHRAASGMWLLGEDFEKIEISIETYGWLWNNVRVICENARLVQIFWANSYQYYRFSLEDDDTWSIYENDEMLKNAKGQRKRFIEFHLAFGGLLLFKSQYDSLKYIFEYSQSVPPNYALFPKSTPDLINYFVDFRNDLDENSAFRWLGYTFPGLDNLGNEHLKKSWICTYIALLMIRNWQLSGFKNSLEKIVFTPSEIENLIKWIDSVDYLRKCFLIIYSNDSLLTKIGLHDKIESINEVISWVERFETQLRNKLDEIRENIEISKDKVEKFYSESNKIVSNTISHFLEVFEIGSSDLVEKQILTIRGITARMPKSGFSDDIPMLYFESILAKEVVNNRLLYWLPKAFYLLREITYVIDRSILINTLFKVTGGDLNLLIVGVNVKESIKAEISNTTFYHNTHFIESSEQAVSNTLFVVKNKPILVPNEISDSEIRDKKLVLINDEYKLYGSVREIEDEQSKYDKNRELLIYATIEFYFSIHRANAGKIVQIELSSEYLEHGIRTSLDDVNEI